MGAPLQLSQAIATMRQIQHIPAHKARLSVSRHTASEVVSSGGRLAEAPVAMRGNATRET
jgi:hypothetical protein